MKGLSIEEKAKAYDGNYKAYTELINRLEDVKEAIKKQNYGIAMDMLCKTYPEFQVTTHSELKESEDERIRKAIKKALQVRCDGSRIISDEPVTLEEAIAWLKKQGEQKTVDEIAKEICKNKTSAIAFLKSAGIMNEKGELAEQYRQDKQKPTDKVEPKFRVGDWITDGTSVFQIVKIEDEWYIADDGERICFDVVHQYYHLWTIQDAKEGDVLVNWNNTVFIFDKIEDNVVKYIIAYNNKWDDIIKCPKNQFSHLGLTEPEFEFRPATKEQRDALMKAMANAGYTFDFENKELKKVEQKQIIDYPDDLPKDNWELVHEFVSKFGRVPKDEDELNSLVEYILKRQKLWSEEDENRINGICMYIMCSNPPDGFTEWIDFLQSLKERYAWKPSDEQMLAINTAINVLGKGTISGKYLIELQEQLKKLSEK